MEKRGVVIANAEEWIQHLGFNIVKKDDSRPWGGFFVIDEGQAAAFAAHFFPGEETEEWQAYNKLSPKILVVKPGARLSWQYHHRRAEIWKCVSDEVGVITSLDNEEGSMQILHYGDIIRLHQGQRHRLIGTTDWGLVAEIWKHTIPGNPSDEEDIVRVQDDYGR